MLKLADDLWLGVKGQSNLEIAGSPEIYLGRASDEYCWGRALLRLGGHPDLPTLCKLEYQ